MKIKFEPTDDNVQHIFLIFSFIICLFIVDCLTLKAGQNSTMNFFIQSVQNSSHLDGGPRHIRAQRDGVNNPGWITWRLIKHCNKSDFYFIQNVETGCYLDGGPRHMRDLDEGTGNSTWITWKLIKIDAESYFIQNAHHGGYLDAGPKHIRQLEQGISNSGWISWKLKANV